LDPAKTTPYYYTTTSGKGTFQFKNLKEGEYTLFAIHDRNNNLKYDANKEKIAYQKNVIVGTTQEEIVLYTSLIQNTPPEISLVQYKDRSMIIRFNKGIDGYRIENFPDSSSAISKDGREVQLYYTGPLSPDSIKTTIAFDDSLGNSNQ